MKWMKADDIDQLDWAPADIPAIKIIKEKKGIRNRSYQGGETKMDLIKGLLGFIFKTFVVLFAITAVAVVVLAFLLKKM